MRPGSLQQRIAVLEKDVAELKRTAVNGAPVKDWRRTIGMFTDDPDMLKILAEALKIRAADRDKAHRQRAKQRPAES